MRPAAVHKRRMTSGAVHVFVLRAGVKSSFAARSPPRVARRRHLTSPWVYLFFPPTLELLLAHDMNETIVQCAVVLCVEFGGLTKTTMRMVGMFTSKRMVAMARKLTCCEVQSSERTPPRGNPHPTFICSRLLR